MRKGLSFIGWMSIGAVGVVGLGAGLLHVGVRWNLSESMPLGFYRMTHEPLAHGQFIAFCLPDETAMVGWARGYIKRYTLPVLPPPPPTCEGLYQPLLKPIAAHGGDSIEMAPTHVAINGTPIPDSATLAQDSKGNPLSHMPWGQYQLGPHELWVMSTHRPNSWDSRYFGPIDTTSVIATATPLWVWK